MSQPIHVILNPTSAGGRARRRRGAIERALAERGVEFVLHETAAPGHATALAHAAVEAGARAVVAAGGDGTVHEVANGLLDAADGTAADGTAADDTATALGVIPVGTGNDFVKQIGGPFGLERACDVIARGEVRMLDAGLAEWAGQSEYFVNGAGTGVDVEVVREAQRLGRLPGFARYIVAVLRAVIGFDSIPMRIRLDDERIERDVLIIAVGNGHSVGGGFRVTPDAQPDDGVFDICVVGSLNYLQIARVLPRVVRGTHTGHHEVEMRRGRVIEIEVMGEDPVFFQLDGELHEPADTRVLRIRLLDRALPVIAPAGVAP